MTSFTFKQFLTETSDIESGRAITLKELMSAAGRGRLAKKLGVESRDLKTLSDEDLENLLQNVGEHDLTPDSEFDPSELSRGIEVENEHTQSKLVAKLIAKDHLAEIPDYYTRLDKMEKDAKVLKQREL